MIPKQSRLEILQNIFNRIAFTRMEIKLLKANPSPADADVTMSDLSLHTSGDFTPLHIPDFLALQWWGWAAALGLNDHSEGEADSPLVDFTAATVDTPYFIYGFAIIYCRDDNTSDVRLYGFARFATPIHITAGGDHVKFYVNVYDDDFVPLGHL